MYPIIRLTQEDPYERGLEYGRQAREKIEICVEYYKKQFLKKGMLWEVLKKYTNRFSEIITETCPEQIEEIRGISAGSQIPLEEILIINARYEISKFPKELECTTGAVWGEAVKDGHMYGFKNWDFNQGARPHIVILDIQLKNGPHMIGFSEAGQIMRDGFSSNGIAILANNLQSVNDHAGYGLPVTCLRRKVLTCATFKEAEQFILASERTVSNNILLIDGIHNKAVDYEWQPDGTVDIIGPEQDMITHANHFIVHPERDALAGRPKNRDRRLRELLMEHYGKIDLDIIKECLKDHKYYTLSVCGHPDPQGDAYSKDRMTVSSMIGDFYNKKVYITAGPPCCNEYVEFEL